MVSDDDTEATNNAKHSMAEANGDEEQGMTEAGVHHLTDTEKTIASSSHSPRPTRTFSRGLRERQDSSKFFGGFGQLNDAVKLHQKIGASISDGRYQTLDILREESLPLSQVKVLQESKIRFKARERSIRQTVLFTLFMLICYFVFGVLIVVRIGGQTIQNALLYAVYTMTSTGFGSVKVPLTQGFMVFLIFFMFYGVACVVLLVSKKNDVSSLDLDLPCSSYPFIIYQLLGVTSVSLRLSRIF